MFFDLVHCGANDTKKLQHTSFWHVHGLPQNWRFHKGEENVSRHPRFLYRVSHLVQAHILLIPCTLGFRPFIIHFLILPIKSKFPFEVVTHTLYPLTLEKRHQECTRTVLPLWFASGRRPHMRHWRKWFMFYLVLILTLLSFAYQPSYLTQSAQVFFF